MENIQVIEKNLDFIAINKPAGCLMYVPRFRKNTGLGGTQTYVLRDWLLERFPELSGVGDDPEERPGMVHRLDQDTSGVVVIARNQAFFDYLKKEFQEHRVYKKYIALVYGRVKESRVIDRPIGIKNGSIKRTTKGKGMRMVKAAVTKITPIKEFLFEQPYTLIEAEPQTGRTHQIRVHLASIGHSIVGDRLYGPKSNKLGLIRQFLHAQDMAFRLKDGTEKSIHADLPESLCFVIEEMSKQ